MSTLIASRVAAMKLFGIVGLLMLPILVLSYLMLEKSRDDRNFTTSQIAGIHAAQELMPVALAAAGREFTVARRKEIAARLDGVKSPYLSKAQIGTLKDLLLGPQNNAAEVLNISVAYMQQIGTDSNLILDPYAESYFLANTAFYEIPTLVQNYSLFNHKLDDALSFAGASLHEVQEISFQLGRLEYAAQRISSVVTSVFKSSAEPNKYSALLRMISGLEQEIKNAKHTLRDAKTGNETAALMALSFRSIDPVTQFKLQAAVWDVSTTELNAMLKVRLSAINQRYNTLLVVAGMCLIFAAAGAYYMFRSTLKKLDHVENAKAEAERMSAQLGAMNNDMVDLNKQLSSKMAMLRDAQDDLVKKGRMEQLGQLTATIAHELRNPLGSVRTSSFLLERKLKGSGLDVEKQFDRINKGIVRCDNIITQLLDYSRTKQIVPKSTVFDDWFVNIVEETAKSLPANVNIQCELGLADLAVEFDASRLERAIINLMNNASEAFFSNANIAEGKVFSNPSISLKTQRRENFILVSVSDNGPGISAENLHRIREPLFTTKSFGTGLGIPAIEQIAMQHDGELIIESVLGHGATFTLRLPISVNQMNESEAA